MWYLYIIECSDKTLYTGITTNLKKRFLEHNTGTQGAKYTRGRRPVKLVYFCKLKNKTKASKEEYRIKRLSRKEKLILLARVAGLKLCPASLAPRLSAGTV